MTYVLKREKNANNLGAVYRRKRGHTTLERKQFGLLSNNNSVREEPEENKANNDLTPATSKYLERS